MFKPLIAVALAASLFSMPAAAQALHDGDIEMSVVAGKLVTRGGHLDLGMYFEGDFGDLASGPYMTDDPGYDSEAGTFGNGVMVNYMALGSLSFWNGSSWNSANVPMGVMVTVDGNLGEETTFSAAGVSGAAMGLIGQATGAGSLHEHLDMTLSGDNKGAVGAYLISLKLTGTNLMDSAPYYVALNSGLSEEAFEQSLNVLAAIPEPSTWALVLFGLAAVGFAARRRRAAA